MNQSFRQQFDAKRIDKILRKMAKIHNVYFRFFMSKNTITCADFPCLVDMLCLVEVESPRAFPVCAVAPSLSFKNDLNSQD